MTKRTSGPDFERSPDQRVVIGPYEPRRLQEENSKAPRTPRPTLLERLKQHVRGIGPSRRRGPGFRRPEGTDPLERAD